MKKKKVIAFIPARGGSKGIPFKNIKLIAGQPLLYYTLKSSLESEIVDEVILSTDSNKIAKCVKDLFPDVTNLRCSMRSPSTATDYASTESAMIEYALTDKSFTDIILLQATSPLTTSQDIDSAFELYEKTKAGGLISVVKQKRFIWKNNLPVNYSPNSRMRRQDLEEYEIENGALYITKRDFLLESDCRISPPYVTFPMHEDTYFELDEPSDWRIVENLLFERSKKINRKLLENIRAIVFDFDGVFTDNKVIVFQNGEEAVVCDRGDGMGMSILKKAGIQCWVISKEKNPVLKARCKKLGVECYHGIDDKLKLLKEQLKEKNIGKNEVAYVGNDINDIEAMKYVKIGIAVADSKKTVLETAEIILHNKGGNGAIREIAELISH